MIDSHCHLDHEPLLSDLANVIQRSKEVGIEKLLTISTSFESFSRVKDLINKDEMIYGTIGIHPHESSKDIITSKQIIESLNENSKIIGIGETGLDFYYNNSEKDKQIASFKEHIDASIKTNIPLIVHTPDYPDRYKPHCKRFSFIFLSKYCHWRQVSNSTHTFLLESKTIRKFEKYIKESSIGQSDSKLSKKIYGRIIFNNKALCVSPIKGLSTHMTEGVMTPLVDWESMCKEYIDDMKKIGIW